MNLQLIYATLIGIGMERTFEAEEIINQAKSVAIQEVENHVLRKHHKDYNYFEMREEQLQLLKRMMPIISSLGLYLEQKEMFADFLEYLSEHVHSGNTTEISKEKLEDCWTLVRQTDLPKTREEFETRANLFYLMNEIGNYLEIKSELLKILQKREKPFKLDEESQN